MGSSSRDQATALPQLEIQAAEERLYSLVQQKETALAEYRHRVELSRATDGYFDPYHLESEEWLDVAHSKWKQVEALQRQYEQDGIKLIPRKPLTRLEEHQQQLQQSMQCPRGSTCSIPVVNSSAHRATSPSLARRPPGAAPSPTATPDSQDNACDSYSICQATATPSATVLQVQAAGGTPGMPYVSSSSTVTNSSTSDFPNPSSSIRQTQQFNATTMITSAAAASSVGLRPLSPLSSKPAPSRLSLSSANDAAGRNAGSSSSGGALASNNRSALCLRPGISVQASMASVSDAAEFLPPSYRRLNTHSRVSHTVFPTRSNHAATAVTSGTEHLTMQDSHTAPPSSTCDQISARHALLQHLGMQQQLLEAEWQRVHNTSIPAALRELLLQPVLQVPGQIEQHSQHAPADLREMLLKPGAALENELQRQKLLHDLEAFRDNTSRMGATRTERAKKLYSTLMYSTPEEVQGGMWAKLCSLASSYRKQRQLTAEQYRLADDLDVMFMRKKEGARQDSELRRLWQWLCNQIPWRSMWWTFGLLWSSIFNTWLLLNARAYSWHHRRRMAWTGYPSIIGQTRGNGALRQFYQNLDQRFVDDEPGHLGLTGLVMAGVLPYLEDSTWTPIAIACRLQSAAAADYKWQFRVWQLEHPDVPFVYLETPRLRPGAIWVTEAWGITPPAADEEDIQLARLVAQHGNTFSKHQLRTALAIYRGVDTAHFNYPTPTLQQLANMHNRSEGVAAAAILRLLLDAEEEQYLLEIEHKQKEILGYRNEAWKTWVQSAVSAIPVLGWLVLGNAASEGVTEELKHKDQGLQRPVKPVKPADLAKQFLAKQCTRSVLQGQEQQLLGMLEHTIAHRNAAYPPRRLMLHLALHCTGGDEPNGWLAVRQHKPSWRCWVGSAVSNTAAILGLSSSSSSFPAVDITLTNAAIQHSKRTAQLEKDMPYILGPDRTAEDLEEPEHVPAGEGWWDALEELKQRMKDKQNTSSAAGGAINQTLPAAEQAPVVSTAALAAAKFTVKEAKAAVAAKQAQEAAMAAASAAGNLPAAGGAAAAASLAAQDSIPPKTSLEADAARLAASTNRSTVQQQTVAVATPCAAVLSADIVAPGGSKTLATALPPPCAAGKRGSTAKHKQSGSRPNAVQGPPAAAAAHAAAPSGTAATAVVMGNKAATAPWAAAVLSSPTKHSCGPSRLGPGSAAVVPQQLQSGVASTAPLQLQRISTASPGMLANNSKLPADSLLSGPQQPGSVASHGSSSSKVRIPVAFVDEANDSNEQAIPCNAEAVGDACLRCSSTVSKPLQDAVTASREASSNSLKEMLSAAVADRHEQHYAVDAGQASFSKPAAAAAAAAPATECLMAGSVPEQERDAVSTSRAASFTSLRDSLSNAAAAIAEQSLNADSLASRLASFTKLGLPAAATAATGGQRRSSSFSFGGKAARMSSSSHASRPDSKEADPASVDKVSSREGSFSLANKVGSREGSLSYAAKAGSREGSFSGFAGRVGSITCKGLVRNVHVGTAGAEAAAEFEVDCSAASDASLRYGDAVRQLAAAD